MILSISCVFVLEIEVIQEALRVEFALDQGIAQ